MRPPELAVGSWSSAASPPQLTQPGHFWIGDCPPKSPLHRGSPAVSWLKLANFHLGTVPVLDPGEREEPHHGIANTRSYFETSYFEKPGGYYDTAANP